MPKRGDEMKGISDSCAEILLRLVGIPLPELDREVEIGDGFYLKHTKPSYIEGRPENRAWNYWLVLENRGQIPSNVVWGLMNYVMQQERK